MVVEVMQLLALINWAPSEDPQKCCLEDTSGGLQLHIPRERWVLSSLLAPTSPTWGLPSPAHSPGTPVQAELAPQPPPLEQNNRRLCPSGICQAPALEPPAVQPAPLPGQPALLWFSPGEAPRCRMQMLLWMIWPGTMVRCHFFLACVGPSSSSAGSDCVVIQVSLPFLSRRGEQGRAIGVGCVCLSRWRPVMGLGVHVHVCCSRVYLCIWPVPAQSWHQLVLQAWSGSRIPVLDYWIWQTLTAVPLGQCALQVCWRWTLPPSRPQMEM